jgi:acyl carrier protein
MTPRTTTRRSAEDVKVLIASCLEPALSPLGLAAGSIPDDFDMRAEGVVDSLGFVQLLATIEQRLGIAIDLADLDPAALTTVGPLSRHIADATASSVTRG